MPALGIHLGARAIVAMLDGEHLTFDGQKALPCALFLAREGVIDAGRRAVRQHALDPDRFLDNPRRRLGAARVMLGDREFSPTHLLGRLLREVTSAAGDNLSDVRLTCPVGFGVGARADLVEAATAAGMPSLTLVPDPVAAVAHLGALRPDAIPVDHAAAVFQLDDDAFGASVVRRTASGLQLLAAEEYPELGGASLHAVVRPYIGGLVQRDHAAKWAQVMTGKDASARQARHLLEDDITYALASLRDYPDVALYLSHLDTDVALTRDEVLMLVEPLAVQSADRLRKIVAAARLRHDDLAGVVFVGDVDTLHLFVRLVTARVRLPRLGPIIDSDGLAKGTLRVSAAPEASAPARRRATTGRLPDPNRSAAVLLATATYTDPDLPDLPTVVANARDLAAALTDTALGGFRPDRVHVLVNPDLSIGERIDEIAETTTDTLLVYYAGHGLVDSDGELHLGLTGSRARRVRYTALPYRLIRLAMRDSPATSRVAIIDCCFSGRAIEIMSDQDTGVVGQLDIAGAYTLTATSANMPARAPGDATHTAFSGELLAALREGISGAGDLIRLTDLHPHLVRRLAAHGLPVPQQRGTNTIGGLALTRNRRALGEYETRDTP
ncbi:caspase, EACC1-associated type [Asanoa iriomotensis]|uniref:Peptidase C14 caspase domain-containing protein n=1 Tax=Asanoa iriomotensis TaxID=234613 RepID=A0ABQ4BXK5_9ACTN|nr:Hsp70 family protein [Asanoa iriomotensis]GIF54896.1 hypothetical protein Air01nite_09910 [Asanoa iriomotensis]